MFHVPEQYRIVTGRQASNATLGNNGAFRIPNRGGATRRRVSTRKSRELFVIASDGLGWEHVSVHVYDAEREMFFLPLWDEMCYIKDLFWDAEDVVMQLHPRKSEYVNNHAYVLHLWRPTQHTIPTPPAILVGSKQVGTLQA
jgi:hypothetical protein